MLKNNEKGFTLIEAMVAMMVCTIGLVAMAELMAVTLRLQQLGRNSTSAVRLAQDKLDELTTVPFTSAINLQMACGGSLVANVANHNDIPREDNGTPDDLADDTVTKGYRRRWVVAAGPVSAPPLPSDTNLRQVTVRVIPDSLVGLDGVTVSGDRRTAAIYELTTFVRGTGPVCP